MWSGWSPGNGVLTNATASIVAQTRQRITGTTPDGSTRVVSLHRQAQPIAKGRLGKPVGFGYKGAVGPSPPLRTNGLAA
jgi:hypothetical protein